MRGLQRGAAFFRQFYLLLSVLFLWYRSVWGALRRYRKYNQHSKPWADLNAHGFFVFELATNSHMISKGEYHYIPT
jgi:hypothetical protein